MSTHRSAVTPHAARGPLRLADVLPVRMSSRGRGALQSLKRHGATLHAMSNILTDDPDLAARLVVRALIARSGEGDPNLQELSTRLVVDWISGCGDRLSRREPLVSASSLVMRDIHRLSDDQRASLALCTFGTHTYGAAALILELPAATVAEHLGTALRFLASAEPLTGDLPITA